MRAQPPRHDDILFHGRHNGDGMDTDPLVPVVYPELRRRARWHMSDGLAKHSLQVAALVNEVYLHLTGSNRIPLHSRTRFLVLSAKLMRRVLVDLARSRNCQTRKISLLDVLSDASRERSIPLMQGVDVFVLDEALRGLALFDPRAAMVLELRLLGGLSIQEIAGVLQVSAKSVKQDWAAAKEWLLAEMRVSQKV